MVARPKSVSRAKVACQLEKLGPRHTPNDVPAQLTVLHPPRSFKIMNRKYEKSIRRRSSSTLAGLPLFDIAYGPDAELGEDQGSAHGIIAIGDEARGWLALGGSAKGFIALGAKARGVIALGGNAIGLIALGGVSVGLISLGGLALGAIALGGLAVGGVAVGGLAAGALSVDRRTRSK
jgi:hypothetical protein